MMSEPFGQAWTLLLMLASAPWVARPGVWVFPISVMSGPPLPLVSAFVQSVEMLVHGTQLTTTFVFLYAGYFFFHCATTPFIQVPWEATEAPRRQTTSLAGAELDAEVLPLVEPQPAMPAAVPASATAAPNAAADLVKDTDRSPFPAVSAEATSSGRTSPGRAFAWRPAPTLSGGF